jgi:cobyric acid synthase
MGKTGPVNGSPFAEVDGKPEGYCADGVVGTYLHGALEDAPVLRALLAEAARRRGKTFDARAIDGYSKQEHYDRLADWFERHIDHARFEELYLQ